MNGVSPCHLVLSGDLIWQIGIGYFGCRQQDGTFYAERSAQTFQAGCSLRLP